MTFDIKADRYECKSSDDVAQGTTKSLFERKKFQPNSTEDRYLCEQILSFEKMLDVEWIVEILDGFKMFRNAVFINIFPICCEIGAMHLWWYTCRQAMNIYLMPLFACMLNCRIDIVDEFVRQVKGARGIKL